MTTTPEQEAAKKERQREQRLEDSKKLIFASYVVFNFQWVLVQTEWTVGFEAGMNISSVFDLSLGLSYILPLSEDEKTRVEVGSGISYREIEITHTRDSASCSSAMSRRGSRQETIPDSTSMLVCFGNSTRAGNWASMFDSYRGPT